MDDHWAEFHKQLHSLTQQNAMSVRLYDSITGTPYDILHKIGVSVKNSGETVSVHKAFKLSPVYADDHGVLTEVAVQICHNTPENNISGRRWKGLDVSHENVLCLNNDFVTSENVYVSVYPKMNFSMRGLINNIYQEGIPEDLIAIIIGETLKGVDHLHEEKSRYFHNLNSDSVYCKLKILSEASIQMGYGCAIYEHNSRAHPKMHHNHLDLLRICEWGCAPEVASNYSRYSKKSEMWLVGLFGLDLFLGGIRARSREDLLDLIQRVLWPKRKRMEGPDCWKLSHNFRDFERKCLDRNPLRRPDAKELLKHNFVVGSQGLQFFRQSVQNAAVERKAKKTKY